MLVKVSNVNSSLVLYSKFTSEGIHEELADLSLINNLKGILNNIKFK